MSDSEDDFVEYGTPLDPIEEDEVPRKKPVPAEDQIVTDAQGRRRFHGAFTGGFSAGFFNTVGSLEGWTPSTFKSSRSERMGSKLQRPEDFMDDEDTGEFGIAPQVLRAKSEFSHLKRSLERQPRSTDGPIPGVPVLKVLLEPARETAGVRMLRRMGWRPGQGVGPRLSKEQKRTQRREQREKRSKRMVGCALPPGTPRTPTPPPQSSSSEEEDEEILGELTFAPEDAPGFVCKPKADRFGMGYQGLDRRTVLSGAVRGEEEGASTSGCGRARLVLGDSKGRGKLSIHGQAFGVGALEEEDDDIYEQEDMSNYDFALGPRANKDKGKRKARKTRWEKDEECLENFVRALRPVIKELFPPPVLPRDFKPEHKVRKSRFEAPASGPTAPAQMQTATQRAAVINAGDSEVVREGEGQSLEQRPGQDELESGEAAERERLRREAMRLTASLPKLSATNANLTFRPFAANPEKQKRYEQFIELQKKGQTERFPSLQPLGMGRWEREREAKEFKAAARLFRPLDAVFSDRFVRAVHADADGAPSALDPLTPVAPMAAAAKEKRFGRETRTRQPWRPADLLCKRFNVAKPIIPEYVPEEPPRKSGASIYDFLKAAPHNYSMVGGLLVPTSSSASASEPPVPAIKEEPPSAPATPAHDAGQSQKSQTETEQTQEEEKEEKEKEEKDKEDEGGKDDDNTDLPFAEPPEKVDLFKAIFLSSSSEEEEEEEEEEKEEKEKAKGEGRMEPQTSTAASAPSTSRKSSTTETMEIEVVASAELPPKEKTSSGVFADLDLDALCRRPPPEPPKPAPAVTVTVHENAYGPRPPPSLPSVVAPLPPPVFRPPPRPPAPSVSSSTSSSSDSDEWVESTKEKKSKEKKKKKKKDKKHKKSSKHKKHKHKHK